MKWVDFLSHQDPHREALVVQQTKERLNYGELKFEAQNWAYELKSRGVKKGDRVAFLAKNQKEHLTMFFGCAYLEAIFVPLNFRLSVGELKEILHLIEPQVFYCNAEYSAHFPEAINIEDNFHLLLGSGTLDEEVSGDLEAPLLMLFTSGSTGTPKGVMQNGRMLQTNMIQTAKAWKLKNDDTTLVETPFFHTGGYNVLCLPLLNLGARVILAPSFDCENVFKTIEEEKISVYFGVPTMFQMLYEHPLFHSTQMSSLRFFVSGGAACSVELIKKYQEKNLPFKQGFGLTEVGPNCFLLEEVDALRKSGSIGRPMPHSDVLVLTLEGQKAQVAQPGELLIKGDHLCLGYFKQEDLFSKSLFDGYFRTGDIVEFDEEGFFYVTGRIKDMYISGGENVYPGEVEKKCLLLPEVHEAVVVAVEDEKWGEVGYAFFRGTAGFGVEELKQRLGLELSGYKRPHYLEWLPSFPQLANGKIDRVALQTRARMRRSKENSL